MPCVAKKEDNKEIKRYYRMDVVWNYLSPMPLKSAEGHTSLRYCSKLQPHSNVGKGFSVWCERTKHHFVLAYQWRVL